MMNCVVITGADGFIGNHLVKKLSEKGVEVYAVIIKKSALRSRIEGIHNAKIFETEYTDFSDISNKLPANPDAFFHLAWAGVYPEARNSYEIQSRNISLCESAVRLAKNINAQKFIVPGSTSEYAYWGKPINGNAAPSPQNTYGSAKVAIRFLCEALCRESELPFIYTAITGIYGADRIDNNVISYTIKKLLKGEKPSLTKLEQIWDYVHIDDLISALALIAEKGKSGSFYCIGHGDNWALSNYIYLIRDLINPGLPLGIGEVPYSSDKIPSSIVDLSALKTDTGFEPKIAFKDGIKDVISVIKQEIIGDSV